MPLRTILAVLRNPQQYTAAEVRSAQLAAISQIERLQQDVNRWRMAYIRLVARSELSNPDQEEE